MLSYIRICVFICDPFRGHNMYGVEASIERWMEIGTD